MKSGILPIICACVFSGITTGCTDLSETVYSDVMSDNYYNTREDVIRAALRPFEHAYWSIQSNIPLNELTADQIMTCTRDGWWDDAGQWRALQYHELTPESQYIDTEWDGCFTGIMQCNYVIDDLNRLDPADFGFTEQEFSDLKAQSRALRAWFYLRLLDKFRNVPLYTSSDPKSGSGEQISPQGLFSFIEGELKEILNQNLVKSKSGLGGNGGGQGQWTQAGVAALLVRLYLNAEVYIGEERWSECITYARKIMDGEYGSYQAADRWDEVFDWDNETSDEVIFAFPSSQNYTFWLYKGDTFWWSVPQQMEYYVNDSGCEGGDHNCKYALTPSYDLNGQLYNYKLGNTAQKFRNYPEDVRLKLYKNLGNNRREGLFVFGSIPVVKNGVRGNMTSPDGSYELYIRDAVGQFRGLRPDQWPADKTSNLRSGDHNSGWHYVKYPLYSDDESGQMEADYVEIRLPEIIYSLAECHFRRGEVSEAGILLNSVRKRNYPQDKWEDYLYIPEGSVTLDEQELLDEWGREFLGEGRRRIDLIRFGKFNTGSWWDKTPDADDHTKIFPVPRKSMQTNDKLKQNPGY